MNNADLDIILEITNGRLTGEAQQDALDRIAADPELSKELAAQIAVMDELSALEPALMTPTESVVLRNSLIEQLHLEPAVPVARAAAQRRPWWQLGLVSAAAVLVAIVVVPSMLSGSDDSSSDVVAIAPEATESVESEPNRGDLNTDADGKTETEGGSDAGATASPSTTLLPHIAADEVQDFFAVPPAPIDTVSTTSADDLADAAEDIVDETSAPSASSSATPDEIAIDLMQVDECLAELAPVLPVGEHTPLAVTLDGDMTTIHFGVDSGSDIEYSVSIELETCTMTSTTP
jgi:hypothetical protein